LSAQAQNMKEQVDHLSLLVGAKADDGVLHTRQNSPGSSLGGRSRGIRKLSTYKNATTEKAKVNGDFQEQVVHLENQDELIPMGKETSRDQGERFKGF
jgi:hypothetical protein